MNYMHFLFWDGENPIPKIRNILELIYGENSRKKANLIANDQEIKIRFPNYKFRFVKIEGDWVKEESMDIARNFGKNRKDKKRIEESRSRIEFYGDEDPNMDYFNDYLLILEKIQKEISITIFDTMNGNFFDEN